VYRSSEVISEIVAALIDRMLHHKRIENEAQQAWHEDHPATLQFG
jgi:hypothetical protein